MEQETAVTPTPLSATATTLATATAVLLIAPEPATSIPQPTPEPPTAIPTAVPPLTPSPVFNASSDPLVISPENAGQLTQLVQFSKGRIDGLSWSPDGELFAITTSQGIELYDGSTLEMLRTTEFAALSQIPNRDFHFSPSGDIAALTFSSMHPPDTVGLVDVANGLFLPTYVPLDISSLPIIFSPDGQAIMYVRHISDEAAQLVWQDTRTGEVFRSIDLSFYPAAFTNETFVEIYQDTTLYLYDTTSEQVQHTIELPTAVNHLDFNPQGNLLAVANQDNVVQLWDVKSGELFQSMALPEPMAWITFSQRGDRLIVSNADSVLRIWDVQSGELLQTIPTNMTETRFITFSPDDHVLVTDDSTGRVVHLWDMNTAQLRQALSLQPGCGTGGRLLVTSNPDGSLLAAVNGSDVQFFDVTSGALQHTLEGYCPGSKMVFNPESNTLITFGGYDIDHWEVPSGQLLQTQSSAIQVRSLAFSPDGKLMAWGGDDQGYKVQLWDRNSDQLLYTIEEAAPPVSRLMFSSDGLLVATQSKDLVQLREVQTGNLLFSHVANHFAISPNGRYLATSLYSYSSSGDILEVWDIATFQLVRRFDEMHLLTFGPDGNLLARQSDEWSHPASWWSVDSGELLRPFPGQTSPLDSHIITEVYGFSPDERLMLGVRGIQGIFLTLADVMSGETFWDQAFAWGIFSPDGHYLATTSGDGIMRLWGLPSGTQ